MIGPNHGVASQTSSTRRRRRVISEVISLYESRSLGLSQTRSGIDPRDSRCVATDIHLTTFVSVYYLSELTATEGEPLLETTGAACTISRTMRKIALLLIVLLGVAHFATVSRCEEGK